MKKRILSMVLVFCMMFTLIPSNAFAAETGSSDGNAGDTGTENVTVNETVNTAGGTKVGDFLVSGGVDGTDYSYEGTFNKLSIKTSTPLTISGTTTVDTIEVCSSVTANITLADVNIHKISNAFSLKDSSAVNLILIGTNILKSEEGVGLGVPAGAVLTIMDASTGSLEVTGGSAAAGIGGYANEAGGTVNIKGGTITATGGEQGAGIGGGILGNGGKVNITGGNVNVIAGSGAQTIGHGGGATDEGTLKGINDVDLNRTVTTVSLEGVTGAGISVTDLTVTYNGENYAYSTAGMKTLSDGKLYLWLPSGATVSEVIADNKDYTGSVTSGDTGTLNDKGTVVASVTTSGGKTTKYVNFMQALDSANASDGSTLILINDVSLDCGGEYFMYTINNKMTLDLNGHTLALGNYFFRTIKETSDFTINDSSEAGTGKIVNKKPIVYNWGGNLTIHGGTFLSETACTVLADKISDVPVNVTITGGIFNGSPAVSISENTNITISGGTYNSLSIASNDGKTLNSVLADGYCYYQGSTAGGPAADGRVREIAETVTVSEIDWSKAVTYDENTLTYTVSSADGLRWISGVSNQTIEADTYNNDPELPTEGYFSGYTVKLNADIDLSGKNWTPIYTMEGTFDGAGHSVTNMTVAEDGSGGFIRYLKSGATVKNLSINGTVTVDNNVSDGEEPNPSYAGGIAAEVNVQNAKTSIENCIANVTVTVNGKVDTISLGGLVGSMSATDGSGTVSLQNCYSGGTVTNNATDWNVSQVPYMGALVGRSSILLGNTGALTNCYAVSQSAISMVGYNYDGDVTAIPPALISVGTYDTNGILTVSDGKGLSYGSDLKTAMKNWVLREGANAVNYVTWTTDAIPFLTTTYATAHTHQLGEWTQRTDGSYISICTECGETMTAEACMTSGNTETPYGTLEEAITAAQSQNNSTVKLLTDVTTEQTVTVSSGEFTIDLNGKTWSSTVTGMGSAGLLLKVPSHVTLKDSIGNGTVSSSCSYTICTQCASLTIEGGTYRNTGNFPDECRALNVLSVNESGRRVTINGGTFKSSNSYTARASFSDSITTITGGTFENDGAFFVNCKDMDIIGGTFTKIEILKGIGTISTIGGLLGDGYAYTNKSDGKWVWISDVSGTYLLDVTVKEAPVKITTQSENTPVTYGYTEAPVLSVTAQKAEGVASDVTYQWYQKDSSIAGATGAAFTVESGLDVGENYSYHCKVTCDGYTVDSNTATVTVNQATGTIENKTYAKDYTYTGNAIVDPLAANFTTNSGGDVTFEWYKGDSTAEGDYLTATPAGIGIYTLKADVANTNNYTAASTTVPVSINYLQTNDVAVLSGDMGENGWYTGDVTVSAPSGYSIAASNGTDAVWVNSLTENTDRNGVYTYYLKQDEKGYITDAKTVTISRDTGSPQIGEVAYSEHQSFLGWLFHNSSIDVTVPVSDTVSGADHISYVLTPDGGTAQAAQTANVGTDGNATFTVKKDFKGTIAVTAYDKAGNPSSPVEMNKMFIEGKAPTLMINDGTNAFTDQWYTTAQTMNISASDAESGIKSVTYSVDGGKAVSLFENVKDGSLTSTKNLTQTVDDGEHSYMVTVTDNALNTTTQKVTIKQDTVLPVLTDKKMVQSEATMTGTKATFTFTASEPGSVYYFTVKKGGPVPDAITVFDGKTQVMTADQNTISLTKLDPNEEYTLYLVAKDVAGNETANMTAFDFKTAKVSFASAEVTLADSNFVYNGTSQTPVVTVSIGGMTMPASMYVINYSNSNGGNGNTTNPGTVTVTVTAKESTPLTGTADSKPTYVIKKAAIDTAGIGFSCYSGTYDGVAHNAVLPVTGVPEGAVVSYSTSTDNGVTWSNDTSNCPQITNAGSMMVKIKISKDNYEDLVLDAKTATVAKKNVTVTASDSITKTYGDEAFSLDAKIEGTMKLSYETDNQSVATVSRTGEVTLAGYGIATITISAQGTNYNTVTKKVVITVNPKIMAKLKAKSSDRKKMKISWKKDSLATGYQIRYSTSKKFTSKATKTVTVKSFKTLSKKIGKLKSGKKYYIQIRAFKKTDLSNLYGDWSKTLKVKVK